VIETESDQSKLARFEQLSRRPYFEAILAANRAYLAAAVPDAPAGAGDRWVLTCLPTTRTSSGRKRLSAISMLNMETFVLDVDSSAVPDSVRGFAIVRRGAALHGFATPDAVRAAFNLDDVSESSYYAAGDDQLRLTGSPASLVRALTDSRIAEAARDLADALTTAATVYARYHNAYLTDEVLRTG
jgi:hypothetical protein